MTRRQLTAAAVSCVAVALVAVLVAVLVVVLRRDSDTAAAPPSPLSTPPPASPSASTDEPKVERGPVLGVKIDNVALARPPTGLSRADIVYVEPVEAGLSRILAVFASRVPKAVGPVRSARETDLKLLRQFGRPTFAYSGAHGGLLPRIRRAPLRDRSPSHAGGAYFRSGSRPAPHNLYANPRKLFRPASDGRRAVGETRVRTGEGVGLRFGETPAGGRQTTVRKVRYRAASFAFRWSADKDRWLVVMDGSPARAAEGGQLGAATVVVQHVTIRPSRFKDVLGNVSPYVETVGSGKALVLRDGRAYRARWSRPRATDDTTFTRAGGDPMTFARGQVWVVFAPRSG